MSPAVATATTPNGSANTTPPTVGSNLKRPNYGSFGNHGTTNGQQQQQQQDQYDVVCINGGSPGANARQSVAEIEASKEMREQEEYEKASLLHRLAKRIPCLGIMMALTASFFLGSAGMLVKMTTSVHGIQISVIRGFIQILIYGFVISVRKLPLWPDKREYWPVFMRAFLGAASITCSYYALKLIPLGDATTIRFSLPIWTLIVGYLLLGEPCNLIRILSVVISISGVVLIAKPEECIYLGHMIWYSLNLESEATFGQEQDYFENFRNGSAPTHMANGQEYRQFEGSLLALASSICLSMSLIAMRMCKKTSAELIILWLSVIGIVIGAITLISMGEWAMPDNWLDVLYILLNGLCGSIGQWFITSCLKVEQSGVISLVRTFDIEIAFMYSALLLHEHIRISSIVGSILVTIGVLTVLVPRWLWPEETNGSPAPSSKSDLETRSEIITDNNSDNRHLASKSIQNPITTTISLDLKQQKL